MEVPQQKPEPSGAGSSSSVAPAVKSTQASGPSVPVAGSWSASRVLGVLFGIATQLLFVWTVWCLFFFLKDGPAHPTRGFSPLVDLAWSLLFAVPHSLLLWPPVAGKLKRFILPAFYGSFNCVVTCVCLLALFSGWTVSAGRVWELSGAARLIVQVAFYLSWLALFYSLSLTGLGYQTGLTPWWNWLLRRPLPRRGFTPRGAYHWFRHPIYLSFLGLIWFTPRMTYDHALLTAVWTVYVFVGSYLKDERLAFYLGSAYRAYQAAVPGYPLIGIGPLGRHQVALSTPLGAHGAPAAAPSSGMRLDSTIGRVRLRSSGRGRRPEARRGCCGVTPSRAAE